MPYVAYQKSHSIGCLSSPVKYIPLFLSFRHHLHLPISFPFLLAIAFLSLIPKIFYWLPFSTINIPFLHSFIYPPSTIHHCRLFTTSHTSLLPSFLCHPQCTIAFISMSATIHHCPLSFPSTIAFLSPSATPYHCLPFSPIHNPPVSDCLLFSAIHIPLFSCHSQATSPLPSFPCHLQSTIAFLSLSHTSHVCLPFPAIHKSALPWFHRHPQSFFIRSTPPTIQVGWSESVNVRLKS